MLTALTELTPLLGYALPPLLGAFIGYLTNRVAIRMLFRPLRQWHCGPFKVPMTPGVIPAKRHQLAVNIGEMVGEQLLTSEEINSALQRDAFQEHLASLIELKVGSLFKQDLGTLPSLIPPGYKSYFDIGYKTLSYQIKDTVHHYLHSATCETVLEQALDRWVDTLLAQQIETLIDGERRQVFYHSLEKSLLSIFAGPALEQWIGKFICRELEEMLVQGKSLRQILPESLQKLIIDTVRRQTPFVLNKAGEVFKEEAVREKLIVGIKKAITDFIATLGPMAGMIKNFVNMDQVEEKIRSYLDEKEDEIVALLHSDELKYRVAATLVERADALLQMPLRDLLGDIEVERLQAFGDQAAAQIAALLKAESVSRTVAAMAEDMVEAHLEHGAKESGLVLENALGKQGLERLRKWLRSTIVSGLRSPQNRQVIDRMIDTLLAGLLARPVGRLDHLIPAGVRDGLFRSIQQMATTMLVSEVPGVVKSINISKIVTDKIDSFDLLQVERLLLSIMQEQFKYINMFGALLGFIIGCANLIVMVRL